MAEPVDPLQSLEAMVDEEGRPTEYFIQQWQALIELVTSVDGAEGSAAANAAAITALKAVTLTAGTGLEGGGDLSADRSFAIKDTAITPGTFGNATNSAKITVDQQGRITAAEDVAISAGGGGPAFVWPTSSTAADTSAFACDAALCPWQATISKPILARALLSSHGG